MVSSPTLTTPGSPSTTALRRPTANRNRASTSAGPALSSSTSSTAQSADSATRPPSLSTAITGMVTSAVRSTRAKARAPARLNRPSSNTTEQVVSLSSSGLTSKSVTVTWWPSSPSAGSTSAVGWAALVSSMTSKTRLPAENSPGLRGRISLMWGPEPVRLCTVDGLFLAAAYYTSVSDGPCYLLGHGFTGSCQTPGFQAVAAHLHDLGASVLALSFRGHGQSEGRSTVGVDEVRDIAAG